MLEVLFVCTGNICRSPLAEAFLVDRSAALSPGGIRVRSAGTWGRRGHPAMPESVAAGAARGLNLESHAASPLSPEAVEAADLVLGMTREHRSDVLGMVPGAAPKTFTLKELAALLSALEPPAAGTGREAVLDRIAQAHALRSGPDAPAIPDQDIADPLGFGEDVYRAIASEIEEGVDDLVAGLFGRVRSAAGEG